MITTAVANYSLFTFHYSLLPYFRGFGNVWCVVGSGDDGSREVCHLGTFIRPACTLRLDGDDTALHIVDVVLILFQGHRDDGDIDLLVDTLLVEAVLQDIACGVGDVVSHLHRLCDGLDGLCMGHFLSRLKVLHDQSEDPEEHKEQGQTEEHDAHGQQGNADAVWVFTLQFRVFGLVGLDEVLDAGSDVLG